MVIFTNKKGLPDAICKAIDWSQSRHVSVEGAYGSVTELNGNPLPRWLRKQFRDDPNVVIEIDYSRMVYLLDGVFAHELFALHGEACIPDGFRFIEKTMSFTVPVDSVGVRSRYVNGADYLISFTPDLVTDGRKVEDYKKTSVFNVEKVVKTKVMKREWEEQLNVYLEGLLRNSELIGGFNPEEISVVTWMRDWGPRYLGVSDSPFKKFNVPVWDRLKRCNHIVSRLAAHAEVDNIIPGEGIPPPCTREERFHKTFIEKHFVPGPKCKGYCDWARVCPYMIEYEQSKDTEDAEDE